MIAPMAYLKSASFLYVLGLVLAGCAPVPVYYKDRTTFAVLEQDLTACEIQALREAPVANEIRQDAPVYYPGRRVCRDGRCYHTSGYWREGRIYTVDVNASLRKRAETSCMVQKNYSVVEAQRCPLGTVRPPKGALHTLLPPTPENCAISVKNGPAVFRPAP